MLLYTFNYTMLPSACKYYRIKLPADQMFLFDNKNLHYQDNITQEKEDRISALLSCDIAQFYAAATENLYSEVCTLRDIKPIKSPDGIIYPPAVVYDSDDNYDFIHPFNPSYVSMGVKNYPEGEFLSPGDIIRWKDDDGETEILWEDKKSHYAGAIFDIERNLKEMVYRHEMIKRSNGATVSTPYLAKYYKEVIGQPNTHVFYNTVVPTDYDLSIETVRKNPNEIRILWQGGNSHFIDWYPLKDAIKQITQQYPQIKWILFGDKIDWVHDVIPENQIEYHPWVQYPAYKLKRGLLNIDINLCPLADNAFNRCKSAIKWYEGSIWNQPEATLAANVGPYKEIDHGRTGLLYNTPEEFVSYLSSLIENPDLRRFLGTTSKEWIYQNRLPEHTIPGLIEFYEDIKARQRYEFEGSKIVVVPS